MSWYSRLNQLLYKSSLAIPKNSGKDNGIVFSRSYTKLCIAEKSFCNNCHDTVYITIGSAANGMNEILELFSMG
jgi:hypothetical protein